MTPPAVARVGCSRWSAPGGRSEHPTRDRTGHRAGRVEPAREPPPRGPCTSAMSSRAPFGTDTRPAGWWRTAVVYQIYPRCFADSDGDGIGDLPGIIAAPRPPRAARRRRALAVAGLPLAAGRQRLRHQRLPGHRPAVRHPGRPRRAASPACHERGMKLVMDLVVNHTSDEHPWFVESRDPASPKRDWYWWRPARARPRARHRRAPSRPTGTRSSPARPGSSTRRSGEYYLHLFSPQAARPQLGEPARSAQAVYAMMRWWLDRGVDGFRMDVINLISKDPALPDGAGAARRPVRVGARRGRRTARGSTSSWPRCTARSGSPRRHLLTVGEMPGSTIEQARRFTDPARREVDMVFKFEHVDLDVRPGGDKWDLVPLAAAGAQAQPRPLAGRAWPTSAGTASTGTTTTSRARCPGSATTPASTGWPRPRRSAPCCTCTAARRTSTRARSSG